MKYYPIVKKWSKIKPFINTKEVQDILVRDFNKFTYGRWHKQFKHGMVPYEFESCDWDCERKGRRPEFWNYVKHAACHWLVNFNLQLAMLVEPNRQWRIVTSELHSTVWDGDETLFDFNYVALRVEPNEAWDDVNLNGTRLGPGKFMKINYATWYKLDYAKQEETILN